MEIFQLITSVLPLNQHNQELYITILNQVAFLCACPNTEASLADRKSQIFRDEKPPLDTHSIQDSDFGCALPPYEHETSDKDSNHHVDLNPSALTYHEKEEGKGVEMSSVENIEKQARSPSPDDQPPSYSPLYPPLYQGVHNGEMYAGAYDAGELPPSYDAEDKKAPLGVPFDEQASSNSNPMGPSPPSYDNDEKMSPDTLKESGPAVGHAQVFDIKDALVKLVQTLVDRFDLNIWADNEPWFLHLGLNVSSS